MKIYPAIDLMNGTAVRLTQGRFDSVTKYDTDPARVALGFTRSGAKCLHLVDLDGAKTGVVQQATLLRSIIQLAGVEVQVGGGIRTLEQVQAYLDAGATRVVIGSLAVRDPKTFDAIIAAVGPTRITLAVDFRRDKEGRMVVALSGWKEAGDVLVADLIQQHVDKGIAHILCTDVGRDGTLSGPDYPVYETLQKDFPTLEIQVSGGIGTLTHLKALSQQGARAVIIGKALYEGAIQLEEALLC